MEKGIRIAVTSDERPKKKRVCLGLGILVVFVVCVVVQAIFQSRPEALTTTEEVCVGSWAYISPAHASPTCIVYHMGPDRSVREEHFFLSSAWPTTPRLTMVGQWQVKKDGRLIVEPNDGVSYAMDSMSGWLNEFFDNGREAWARPVLRRSYELDSTTNGVLRVQRNRSGGKEQFIMLPYNGDPTKVASP